MGCGFSPHQTVLCDTSGVSYNITQFWHCHLGIAVDQQIPRVKNSVPQDFMWLPTSDVSDAITGPDCYLCFWPISCKLEVPMTISSGSVNSGKQFTYYLLVYYKRMKDTDAHPDGRDAKGKVYGKGPGASTISQAQHSPSSSTGSLTQKLSDPILLAFLWKFLQVGMISYNSISNPFPLSRKWGMG